MADDAPVSALETAAPAPKPRTRSKSSSDSAPAPKTSKKASTSPSPKSAATGTEKSPPKKSASTPKDDEEQGAPKRPTLDARTRTLLRARRTIDRRRPIFGRQAANRYFRIGRDGSWRRPRGLQSKQRRHYGYRAELVSIGYGSPARVRGLVPSGYRPVIVHTDAEIEGIDPKLQAAVIARTVGTRRRLGLEETARKRGVHVLNPIRTAGEE